NSLDVRLGRYARGTTRKEKPSSDRSEAVGELASPGRDNTRNLKRKPFVVGQGTPLWWRPLAPEGACPQFFHGLGISTSTKSLAINWPVFRTPWPKCRVDQVQDGTRIPVGFPSR